MSELAAVLVDSGPLVALVLDDDDQHKLCLQALKRLSRKTALLIPEPVLTEAFYLASIRSNAVERLFHLLADPGIRLVPIAQDGLVRAGELMRTYSDLPMDFADAAVVVLAEKLKVDTIFTLDRRDFSVYRPKNCKTFRLIP